MDWKAKLAEAKQLVDRCTAVVTNPDAPGEDKAKVTEWMQTVKALQAEAAQLKDIEATAIALKAQVEGQQGDKRADPQDSGQFKSWEGFLEAVWRAQHKNPMVRRVDPRLVWFDEKTEGKDMAEGTGATGGFLVPPDFRAQLYGAMGEGAVVRPRASIIRMTTRQVTFPVVDQTGTTAGVPHWFGGLMVYHAEEAEEKSESTAKWRQFMLTANKIIGYTRASDELVSDSAISLGDFLSGPFGFSGAFTWQEDYDFLRGTGAGQSRGVIDAPCTIVVPRAADSPLVGYEDLINMMVRFMPTGRGLWVISQSVLALLLTMEGPSGNPSYLWGNAVSGVPSTLLGWPVVVTEKLPVAGTQGDVLLADFRYYVIGDRQAFTVETTQYDRWRYDQTSWRAVHRVDGQPWLSAPLTYQDGVTQISPFVVLGDKST